MSNKYSPCGNFIIDSTGKQWRVNVPHRLPLPPGIEEDADKADSRVRFAGVHGWTPRPYSTDTHWAVRIPLPPIPRPKTQAELDEEAAQQWIDANVNEQDEIPGWNISLHTAFKAGAAYARTQPTTTR